MFEDAEPAIFNTSYPTQEEIIGKFRKQVQAYGKLPKAAEEKIIDLGPCISKRFLICGSILLS